MTKKITFLIKQEKGRFSSTTILAYSLLIASWLNTVSSDCVKILYLLLFAYDFAFLLRMTDSERHDQDMEQLIAIFVNSR